MHTFQRRKRRSTDDVVVGAWVLVSSKSRKVVDRRVAAAPALVLTVTDDFAHVVYPNALSLCYGFKGSACLHKQVQITDTSPFKGTDASLQLIENKLLATLRAQRQCQLQEVKEQGEQEHSDESLALKQEAQVETEPGQIEESQGPLAAAAPTAEATASASKLTRSRCDEDSAASLATSNTCGVSEAEAEPSESAESTPTTQLQKVSGIPQECIAPGTPSTSLVCQPSPFTPSPKRPKTLASSPSSPKGQKAGLDDLPGVASAVALESFDLRSRHAPCRIQRKGSRQLRATSTNEADDYVDLMVRNRRFISECPHGGEFILGAATYGEKLVFFITVSGQRVGYLVVELGVEHDIVPLPAMVKNATRQLPAKVPILQHLYIDQGFRKRGIASAALTLFLAKCAPQHVVVDSPVVATARILDALAYRVVGARHSAQGGALVLYLRARGNL